MSKLKPPKWQPSTSTYEYNYGIGMNFYQPMVDYIEEKNRKRSGKVAFPHLPWTDELGLDQYDPLKIKSYSQEDLSTVARATEASAKEKLRDFRSSASSSFVLQKSVSAATITQKVKKITRQKQALVKEIDKLKHKMYDDLESYDPEKDKAIERELFAQQKYLRGKSAKAIEAQLLSKSNKVIAEAIEHDIKKLQREQVVNTHDYRAHITLMDKRMQTQLEDSFSRPLDTLSHELKSFDKRSTSYFIDKR